MAAYDPKRPRPGNGDVEEPAPVEALLDLDAEDTADADLAVTETVSEELLVDPESGDVVGARVITDDVVRDAETGEVIAEEIVIEEVTVDGETGDVSVETTVIEELVTEDGVVLVSETVVDDLGVDPLEVDLRDATPNGSTPRVGSDVPVASAPEEGTANRAVLIAGVSAAAVVAFLLAILLRRRRRAG